jgi:hypothetical protein
MKNRLPLDAFMDNMSNCIQTSKVKPFLQQLLEAGANPNVEMDGRPILAQLASLVSKDAFWVVLELIK